MRSSWRESHLQVGPGPQNLPCLPTYTAKDHTTYSKRATELRNITRANLANGLYRSSGGPSGLSICMYSKLNHLPKALQILNNRPIGKMETPLMRMTTPNLQIKPLTVAETLTYWEIMEGALAPYRATLDAAGLYSLQMHSLNIRGICVIDTGIGVYIPSGYFGLIAPRPALAIKGIQILGGIIDSDYQGEIKVIFKGEAPQITTSFSAGLL
uniref:Deoxyuridine 5'-triphosphate nucleotidohydrolase n=1 Tax=Amazona collaria TaxID=241587 RepID=A0A8B9FHT7_9PSIT